MPRALEQFGLSVPAEWLTPRSRRSQIVLLTGPLDSKIGLCQGRHNAWYLGSHKGRTTPQVFCSSPLLLCTLVTSSVMDTSHALKTSIAPETSPRPRKKLKVLNLIYDSTLVYAFGYDSIPGFVFSYDSILGFAFGSDLNTNFEPEEPWPYDCGGEPVDTYHPKLPAMKLPSRELPSVELPCQIHAQVPAQVPGQAPSQNPKFFVTSTVNQSPPAT